MNFKIDFSEPMPQMIDRLKGEHLKLLPELSKVEKACGSDMNQVMGLLHKLKDIILRHAVEEEARVMKVIMEKAKSDSLDSVRIMQEHRWVSEFFERRLDRLPKETKEKASDEVLKFIQDLRQHFQEEEQVVFPLALKAITSSKD
ncbi:MAG: hemerythrin domain-containing protein [Nitrososphaerales archaeon]